MTVVFGKWEEREDMNLNVFVGNIKKFQLSYKAVGDFVVNYFQKLYIYQKEKTFRRCCKSYCIIGIFFNMAWTCLNDYITWYFTTSWVTMFGWRDSKDRSPFIKVA